MPIRRLTRFPEVQAKSVTDFLVEVKCESLET